MLLRTVLLLVGLTATASLVNAQAIRTEVRALPDAADRTVAFHPDFDRAVYRSEDVLLFETGPSIRRVELGGFLMDVVPSATGAYTAALVRPTSGPDLDFRVYSAAGSTLWDLPLRRHPDDRLPRVAVSDASGAVAYALPSTAEVCFAGAASDSRCITLFKEGAHADEREVLLDFSPDGRFIAAAAQREPAGPGQDASKVGIHVFLFDAGGTLLWERTLPEPSLRSLAFSPGSDLAVSTYDAYSGASATFATRILSIDGATRAEAPYGAEGFAFGDAVVLLHSSRSLASVRLHDGSVRPLFRPSDGMQIVSVDRTPRTSSANVPGAADAAITAVLTGQSVYSEQGFVFSSLQLMHLDDSGTVIDATSLDVAPQSSPRLLRGENSTTLVLDHAFQIYTR